MSKSFWCSTSPPAKLTLFDVVSVPGFGHSNRCVVVSFCFNLHFPHDYDVEHLFICLFAICISSLLGCLLRSLNYCLIRLFVFLLLSFKQLLFLDANCPQQEPGTCWWNDYSYFIADKTKSPSFSETCWISHNLERLGLKMKL